MFLKFITAYQWRFLPVFLLLGFLLGFSVHKLVLYTFVTSTSPTVIIYSAEATTSESTSAFGSGIKPRSISQLKSLLHTLDAQINASTQVIKRLRQRQPAAIPTGTLPLPVYHQIPQQNEALDPALLIANKQSASVGVTSLSSIKGSGELAQVSTAERKEAPPIPPVQSQTSPSFTTSGNVVEPSLISLSYENCFPRSEVDRVKFYHPQPPPHYGFHCTHPQGCIYVVYVLPFVGYLGEQFSQQRLAIMETIHLVKSLGSQYVLVEPIFIITPHDNVKIEMLIRRGRYQNAESTLLGRYLLKSRAIYDLQLLNEYFNDSSSATTQKNRIILWDDFIQLFERNSTSWTSRVPILDFLVMDHGLNPFEPNMKLACENSVAGSSPSALPSLDGITRDSQRNGGSLLEDDMKMVNAYQEFYNTTFLVYRTFCQEAIRDGGWPITNKGLSAEQRAMKKRLYYAGQVYRAKLLEAVQTGVTTLLQKYSQPSQEVASTGSHSVLRSKRRNTVVGFYLWRSLISDKLYQWIEDPNLDYIAIRKKLLFSKFVWDTAFNYVQSEMLRPYVAMHIRRGDQLAKGLNDPYRSLDKAVELITRTVQRTNSRGVFIMTDIQIEEDLVSLRKKITTALSATTPTTVGIHYFRKTPTAWRTEVQMMFVEMAVCTLADYFISSDRAYWASATPSRDIIEVRNLVFGMNKHTTIWFGRPGGARWKGPVVDTFTHGNDC